LQALTLLGGPKFLPVHWGTFNLAMHAWDEPAETLLQLAPLSGAHLVMPRLGEPVEPSRAESVTPWWRAAAGADSRRRSPSPDEEPPSLPPTTEGGEAVAWPMD
jgi:hypothetical protein